MTYLPVVTTARARHPVSLTGRVAAASAIVVEVAQQLAPLGFRLVRGTPGDPWSYAGARVDQIASPQGEAIEILADVGDRAWPVWRVVGLAGGTVAPPSAPTVSLGGGRVTIAGREFARGGQTVRVLAVNGLAAVGRWRRGESAAVEDWLAAWVGRGATAVRVATTLGGDAWDGTIDLADGDLRCGPTVSGTLDAVVAVAETATTVGLLPIVTVFGPGALSTVGARTPDERAHWLARVVDAVAGFPSLLIEIAYEPAREGWSGHEVLALVEAIRAHDPARLAAFGAEVGEAAGSVGDPRRGHWLSVHPDRGSDMLTDPWGWVLRLAGGAAYQPTLADVPVVLLQPMTAGEGAGVPPRRVDADPARYYAYGVLSALLGWEAGFTSASTVRVLPEQSGELACADEWLTGAGRVRLPMTAQWGFRVGVEGAAGQSPFTGVGAARRIIGRHDEVVGEAVVCDAATNWHPWVRPGWTATVLRAVGGTRLVEVRRG